MNYRRTLERARERAIAAKSAELAELATLIEASAARRTREWSCDLEIAVRRYTLLQREIAELEAQPKAPTPKEPKRIDDYFKHKK